MPQNFPVLSLTNICHVSVSILWKFQICCLQNPAYKQKEIQITHSYTSSSAYAALVLVWWAFYTNHRCCTIIIRQHTYCDIVEIWSSIYFGVKCFPDIFFIPSSHDQLRCAGILRPLRNRAMAVSNSNNQHNTSRHQTSDIQHVLQCSHVEHGCLQSLIISRYSASYLVHCMNVNLCR